MTDLRDAKPSHAASIFRAEPTVVSRREALGAMGIVGALSLLGGGGGGDIVNGFVATLDVGIAI